MRKKREAIRVTLPISSVHSQLVSLVRGAPMNADLLAPLALPTQIEDDGLEILMQRRLGNRVRGLRIVRLPAGLIIQGRATTYHAKQLATHAAMELAEEPILSNDIEVL